MLFIWSNNNMLINLLDLNYTALEDVANPIAQLAEYS